MLSQRLRALRRQAQMTQEDVARQLGCLRETVSHYERGMATPPLYMADKLAQLYHVSLDDLVHGVPDDSNGATAVATRKAPRRP
jgi:transcriptional regulator with XRE-family HTH domain